MTKTSSMIMWIQGSILFLLSLFALRAEAGSYTVSSLGLEQGLSCNYVVDMTQDKNGFLWFATEEGLNRFDGERFFNYYKSRSTQSISSSELNCVLDDPRHPWLWIGTKNDGLNRLDYDSDTFLCYRHDPNDKNSISTNDITHIAPTANGNVWITTYWKGVEYLDTQKGTFVHYNKENVKGMPDNQFWCVTDLGNGIVMAGHVRAGMSIIDTHNRVARNYRHDAHNPNSISGDEVECIYKDRNGTVWIGTAKGLDIFDQVNQRFIHVAENELKGFRIYDIRQLSDGNIWVATESKGVAVVNLNRKPFDASHHYPCTFLQEGDTEYNLAGNSVRCLLEDKYHNVWAGLYGNGINFLTQSRPLFETITYGNPSQQNRLTERSVMALALDRDGKLWVGTDGNGANVFSSRKERIATYPTEMGRYVIAACCDSKGNLWLGSFDKGGYVKSPSGGFSRLPLEASDVRCFYEDRHGRMWVGTSMGIYVMDTATMKVVKRYRVGNNLVRAITQDGNGRIWVGYYGYGIDVFDAGMKWVKHLVSSSSSGTHALPSNIVNHLFFDSQRRVWAATNEGAVCFSGGNIASAKTYAMEEGLYNAHVRAFAEDGKHNIWMSTNRGISCLTTEGRILNFGNKDNVPQANFNDACVTQAKGGWVYFGSSQGLCYFNPSQVLRRHQAPRVFITSLTLISTLEGNDSIVNLTNKKRISLAYNENTFSLSFNVQNYALERYVEYSYLLQGMQEDWITTKDGIITLRDIPAGNYKLQVRSRMHNQPWSEEIAELDITIRPPFWRSWWAKCIYLLAAIAVAWMGLYSYKRHLRLKYLLHAEKINHEQEQRLNEERLRFFTNITHELRTPLTLILGPLDDISHSTDISKGIKHKLAMIHQSAVRLNELITQILEFRKTETENKRLHVTKGNIVDAVHEISLKYEELAQKPNVGFRFVAPDKTVETYFDPEVVRTIVDNLVSNAIKYTDQGNIDISVERRRQGEAHLIDITVSDTGHGISADALPHIFDRYYQENGQHQASGTGIGLSLVKNLVRLHEGEIKVESSLEQGTSFIFTIHEDNVYPTALHGRKETAPQSVAQEPGMEAAAGKKPQLLVVEDNRDILEYIAGSFSRDFETFTAENGKEGLALALDRIPDIIISDVMMPGMDGNEMCRILKADVRTSHVPVILLTAKDSLEAKEEGYCSGADSYITKPFTHSLLLSRIQNLLAQRKRSLALIQESKDTDLTEKKQQLRESLNKVDREFFDRMNRLIEENIGGDVDVNMLAEHLAMSASTLYRKMKALTGISTNEYIRKYKMQYAEHLLLEGKYTISEISFMVGMNSVAYFRRCFKAEYGEIPSEYLKRMKGES